ncbi:unnamed protein product, partial [Allacma fusca]
PHQGSGDPCGGLIKEGPSKFLEGRLANNLGLFGQYDVAIMTGSIWK